MNGAPPLLHLRERSLSTTRRKFVRMRMVRSFREYVGSRPARAALEVSAAIDQCQTIPQRKRCFFPKSDARTLAHHTLAIGSVQKHLRIESLRPFHHRRVIMRMRDRDGADTAARVKLGSGLAVEKREATQSRFPPSDCRNRARWPIANSGSVPIPRRRGASSSSRL